MSFSKGICDCSCCFVFYTSCESALETLKGLLLLSGSGALFFPTAFTKQTRQIRTFLSPRRIIDRAWPHPILRCGAAMSLSPLGHKIRSGDSRPFCNRLSPPAANIACASPKLFYRQSSSATRALHYKGSSLPVPPCPAATLHHPVHHLRHGDRCRRAEARETPAPCYQPHHCRPLPRLLTILGPDPLSLQHVIAGCKQHIHPFTRSHSSARRPLLRGRASECAAARQHRHAHAEVRVNDTPAPLLKGRHRPPPDG